MTLLVVDASVAIKWYSPEVLSSNATSLLSESHDFIAPDFMLIEIGNILWKKTRRSEMKDKEARYILNELQTGFIDFMPSLTLIEQAYTLGKQLNHSLYDCLYLTLAVKEDSTVITADKSFADCCNNTKWQKHITFLGDFAPQR